MPTADAAADPPPVRIRVVAGSPVAEEVAAITAVLLAQAATAGGPPPPPTTPAWGRASRMEAVGQAPFASSVDPRLRVRSSGPSGVTPTR